MKKDQLNPLSFMRNNYKYYNEIKIALLTTLNSVIEFIIKIFDFVKKKFDILLT